MCECAGTDLIDQTYFYTEFTTNGWHVSGWSVCTAWPCVHRYDGLHDDGNDNFEGITNLVEHPIQMKPPGELSHI